MGERLSKEGNDQLVFEPGTERPHIKPEETSQTGLLASSPYEPIAPAFTALTGKTIGAQSRFQLIGLMSGTSFDGIDAAILSSDGDGTIEAGATHFFAYSEEDRFVLRRAMDEAASVSNQVERTEFMQLAETIVTDRHITAVKALLEKSGTDPSTIDAVGFHGQTVIHRPDLGFTVQLGDAQRIADHLSLPVIYDLRSNDMAHGGQGAPLVPIYHRGLVRSFGCPEPLAFVNIGGVSNVSYISGETLVSFDVGPGNALLDDWVERHTGARFDEGGALAASGTIDKACLADLLDNPYFALPAPKSLDRNAFSLSPVEALGPADGAATLTEFTANALAGAERLLPEEPVLWVISGGGAQNPFLMDRLAANIGAPVKRATNLGIDGDFVEAQAFAFLGIRALKAWPLTFPGTTGTNEPATGGQLAVPTG